MEAASVRAKGTRDLRLVRPLLGVRLQVAALVAFSSVVRALASVRYATPRYFPDEYIYAAIGRSIGAHGDLEIRGGPVHFPALLEPLVAAPLWALSSLETAYRLVQLENALFMSLAAVPAYLIARRLGLSHRYALLCGAFAVAIPDLAFSGYVLADPVAYPLVVSSVYAALVALERPRLRSELAFLGLAGLATAARVQYAVLFVAFGVAAAALERRRVLRVHRGLGVMLGAAAVLAVALGPTKALGYYSGVLNLHVGTATARWAAVDLFLLALASGAVLVPGAVVGLLRPHGRTETAFSWLAAAFGASILLEAALFASNGSNRFQERYLFTLLPLIPIAFGLYARRSSPPRLPLLLVAGCLIAALARLPLSGYAAGAGRTDSPFLFSVSELELHIGVGVGSLAIALAGSAAVVLGVLPRLRRRTGALAMSVLLLVSLMSIGATVQNIAYADSVRSQYFASNPAWIDALHLKDIAAIQTAYAPREQLLEQLFWNRSVTRELVLDSAEPTDVFASTPVGVAPDGTLRTSNGILRSPILFQGYAVGATFDGAVLAAHSKTFDLWQPTTTPRVRVLAVGRYWDGWLAWNGHITAWPDASGYTRGTLSFTLSLPRDARPVRLRVGRRDLRIRPGERLRLQWRLDGRGPQTLAFSTKDGSVARDLRPVSVRSTMPVFKRLKGA